MIMSMKNSNKTIGNRSRDLPVCSTVPQPLRHRVPLPLWGTWINTVQPDTPPMSIRHMRNACCVTKATNTHTEYVIFIAFPLQQLLHERGSMLRYSTSPVLFATIFMTRWWSIPIETSSYWIKHSCGELNDVCLLLRTVKLNVRIYE
jgi:hypothetical protein